MARQPWGSTAARRFNIPITAAFVQLSIPSSISTGIADAWTGLVLRSAGVSAIGATAFIVTEATGIIENGSGAAVLTNVIAATSQLIGRQFTHFSRYYRITSHTSAAGTSTITFTPGLINAIAVGDLIRIQSDLPPLIASLHIRPAATSAIRYCFDNNTLSTVYNIIPASTQVAIYDGTGLWDISKTRSIFFTAETAAVITDFEMMVS